MYWNDSENKPLINIERKSEFGNSKLNFKLNDNQVTTSQEYQCSSINILHEI